MRSRSQFILLQRKADIQLLWLQCGYTETTSPVEKSAHVLLQRASINRPCDEVQNIVASTRNYS